MRTVLIAAAVAAFSWSAAPALAQDASVPPNAVGGAASDFDKQTITVGAVGAYVPDYEGSNNYRLVPAPVALGSIKGFNFQLAGNRLSVDLIPNPPGPSFDIQLGPVAVINFNRDSRKSIDDDRVKALGKVDTALELGGYVGIGKTGVITSPYDKLSASISYRHDVTGVHDSYVLQPSINYLTPLSTRTAVGIVASAERAGRGYATTYFSVDPAQSLASTLPVYSAHGGWKDYSIGALATQSITGNLLHGFKLVGGFTYSRLLNDFADSPLVSVAGSRSQWLGALGVAYTF